MDATLVASQTSSDREAPSTGGAPPTNSCYFEGAEGRSEYSARFCRIKNDPFGDPLGPL